MKNSFSYNCNGKKKCIKESKLEISKAEIKIYNIFRIEVYGFSNFSLCGIFLPSPIVIASYY